jgi:hypothetical protein
MFARTPSLSQRLMYSAAPRRTEADITWGVKRRLKKALRLPRCIGEPAAHTTEGLRPTNRSYAAMLLSEHENDNRDSSTPSQSVLAPRKVYIVTDTYFPTAHDFDVGKGIVNIDSVHSTPAAAKTRAQKIMFVDEKGQDESEKDKIIEDTKQGLYIAIGIGGRVRGCYARKCEVEAKAVDLDEDDTSEEDVDATDWNMR